MKSRFMKQFALLTAVAASITFAQTADSTATQPTTTQPAEIVQPTQPTTESAETVQQAQPAPAEQAEIPQTEPQQQTIAEAAPQETSQPEETVQAPTEEQPAQQTEQVQQAELTQQAEQAQLAEQEKLPEQPKQTTEKASPAQETYKPLPATSGFVKADTDPYLVTDVIDVPAGKSLVIAGGVTIKFAEGAGINVHGGTFTIAGEDGNMVQLLAKEEGKKWNGISITGAERADLNFVQIEGADIAVAVENGAVDLRNSDVSKFTSAGVFAKASNVNVQNSNFTDGTGAAIRTSENASVELDAAIFKGNKVAILAGQGSEVSIESSKIEGNEYGILDLGNNAIRENNSTVENNKVGYIAEDLPSDALKPVFKKNELDLTNGAIALAMSLPEEPSNEYARQFKPVEAAAPVVTEEKHWSLTGNVASQVGYHLVRTRHNHSGETYIAGADTVSSKDRYKNYFQTPGLFADYNTYLKLESPEGRTLEFSANFSSDHWNEFNVNTLNLTYTDSLQKASLGDTYISAGETYLSGTDLFGATYDLNLFKISSGQPMFVLSLFAGETNKPKLVGDKNPDIYRDYIEDGEGEGQEVLAGGKLTWNMHRRFNGTLGFIGSKSFQEDPILRDGMSKDRNTANLLVDSKTFFADGNWLFWPGDIELNGQIAFGAADTADVLKQRAINKVFTSEGLSVTNFALLRKLMNDPNKVAQLTTAQLEEIFGDNTAMTPSEMRNQLRKLLAEAKKVQSNFKSSEIADSDISDWDGDNIAAAASLRWVGKSTAIAAHFKFTGAEFYSAGSPDQLSNAREFGLNIDQKILKFWKLALAYDLNIENAANGNQYNVFGLGEGTTVGFFGEASDKWKEQHELDENRTQYVNDASLKNILNIGMFQVTAKYGINYRTRNKPTRLYGSYSAESGVYEDSWFKPTGNSVIDIPAGSDTITVDSARFEDYYALSKESFLAGGFEEKLLKHTAELEVALKLNKNTFKVGGVWTYRTDLSEFENDSLIKDIDFSNKTYGLLGYYFHSGDYFEQRYPVSLISVFDSFRNEFSVTPRYKMYKRDSQKEFEWTVSESLEFPIVKEFMELSLNGSFRQDFIRRHSEGDNESEADIDGSINLRVYFTNNFYSDYTLGAYYNYRPDSRADEYRDYYGIFALNYEF